MYKVRECTLNDIKSICGRLRDEDIKEIQLSGFDDTFEALVKSMDLSDLTLVDTINNSPEMIGGITYQGVIWCMTTKEYILNHRKRFHTVTNNIIKENIGKYKILWNYVYSGNTVHIKWLKRVGFTFSESETQVRNGELFILFYMEN